MDDTKLLPITYENLDQLIAIAAEYEMPRSKRWYKRLLFSDFQKNASVECRGYLVKSDADGVVGCLCLAPIEGWFKQTQKTFCRIAIFACRKKYGVHALEMIAKVIERAGSNLIFTNSLANKTALACWKFGHFQDGPDMCKHLYFINIGLMGRILASRYVFRHFLRSKIVYLLLRPLDWMVRKGYHLIEWKSCEVFKDFTSPAWDKFWNEFLLRNDGIVTSRSSKILSDLFNESLLKNKIYNVMPYAIKWRLDQTKIGMRLHSKHKGSGLLGLHDFTNEDLCVWRGKLNEIAPDIARRLVSSNFQNAMAWVNLFALNDLLVNNNFKGVLSE